MRGRIVPVTVLLVCACHASRPPGDATQIWTVDVMPSLRIDWDPETPGYDLFDIKAVARLGDGRLAIVDGGSAEVRLFDAEGGYLGFTGGDGDGPGALRRIRNAVRGPGDTLVIQTLDPAIVRVDAGTGVVAEKVPLDPGALPTTWSGAGILTGSGMLVYQPSSRLNRSRSALPEGRYRDVLPLIRLDPSSGALDTLGAFPAEERTRSATTAFPRRLVLAQAGARLFVGETGGDSVLVMESGGERLAWHVDLERRPVPHSFAMEAAKSRRKVDLPSHFPRFARILADRAGNLWVQAYPEAPPLNKRWFDYGREDTGGDWLVLSPAGVELARVRMPEGLRVLEIGEDYVLGTVREDVNVDSVRLYALRKVG